MSDIDKDIELSPKYGVNAFIPSCFWCGQLKNQVAMAGRVRVDPETGKKVRGGDFEMKPGAIIDYEECDECKKTSELGVKLIEAIPVGAFKDNRPAIGKDHDGNPLAPTGRWLMLSETSEMARINGWIKGQEVMVDESIMNHLVEMLNEANMKSTVQRPEVVIDADDVSEDTEQE